MLLHEKVRYGLLVRIQIGLQLCDDIVDGEGSGGLADEGDGVAAQGEQGGGEDCRPRVEGEVHRENETTEKYRGPASGDERRLKPLKRVAPRVHLVA